MEGQVLFLVEISPENGGQVILLFNAVSSPTNMSQNRNSTCRDSLTPLKSWNPKKLMKLSIWRIPLLLDLTILGSMSELLDSVHLCCKLHPNQSWSARVLQPLWSSAVVPSEGLFLRDGTSALGWCFGILPLLWRFSWIHMDFHGMPDPEPEIPATS